MLRVHRPLHAIPGAPSACGGGGGGGAHAGARAAHSTRSMDGCCRLACATAAQSPQLLPQNTRRERARALSGRVRTVGGSGRVGQARSPAGSPPAQQQQQRLPRPRCSAFDAFHTARRQSCPASPSAASSRHHPHCPPAGTTTARGFRPIRHMPQRCRRRDHPPRPGSRPHPTSPQAGRHRRRDWRQAAKRLPSSGRPPRSCHPPYLHCPWLWYPPQPHPPRQCGHLRIRGAPPPPHGQGRRRPYRGHPSRPPRPPQTRASSCSGGGGGGSGGARGAHSSRAAGAPATPSGRSTTEQKSAAA